MLRSIKTFVKQNIKVIIKSISDETPKNWGVMLP